MKVWVITFFSSNAMRCVDGVYAVASTLEKARAMVDTYCNDYEEEVIDYEEHSNGVHCVYTSKGQYNIEPIDIDEP